MPRPKDGKHISTHISFSKETLAQLNVYLAKYFSGRRALSMLVDRAVKEYLARHKGNGKI